MKYWLIKSEPEKYSWDKFVKDGRTFWDGVRNYAARNNLRAMKKGDLVLFYHSNEGKEVVGLAAVSAEATPEETTDEGEWGAGEPGRVRADLGAVGHQALTRAGPASPRSCLRATRPAQSASPALRSRAW